MPIYPILTEWVEQSEMTAEEKSAHPGFGTTGGYLKKNDFKEAYIKAWNKASDTDRAWFLKLPNFDADIFFEITGVDLRASSAPSLSGKNGNPERNPSRTLPRTQ